MDKRINVCYTISSYDRVDFTDLLITPPRDHRGCYFFIYLFFNSDDSYNVKRGFARARVKG